jgi:hypothetical protein
MSWGILPSSKSEMLPIPLIGAMPGGSREKIRESLPMLVLSMRDVSRLRSGRLQEGR